MKNPLMKWPRRQLPQETRKLMDTSRNMNNRTLTSIRERLFPALGMLSLLPAFALAEPAPDLPKGGSALPPKTAAVPVILSSYPLSSLENSRENSDLSITGQQPENHLYFSVRQDEIIARATLNLLFTPSPALIPVRSQLNVYLNGSLQKTLPIEEDMLGRQNAVSVELNPLLIRNYNDLRFQFIGHYTDICEDQLNTALWLNISQESALRLSRQKLITVNDLAFMKALLFNPAAREQNTLSLALAATPDPDTVKAAGIIASWGGILSDWRGIDYPVFLNQKPVAGNAVAFVTNKSRPDFLRDYPEVQTPTVEMQDLPGTLNGKLIIIAAPDAAGLITAAKAITRGDQLMKGPRTEIISFAESAPRKPYDAPKWADVTREVTLGELALYDGQLISSGMNPRPINVTLNLPPDLYFSEGSHIRLNLRHRYSNPPPHGISEMNFRFNNHLVRSYQLTPAKEGDGIAETLFLGGFVNVLNQTRISALYLRPKNQLTFTYTYSHTRESEAKNCISDVQPLIHQAEVDPNSSLDFTGLYHFTRMPNLGYYWQSGYPFSVYADLGNTAVIMGAAPEEPELNTLFNALGRIGSQTGYPAYNATFLFAPGEEVLKKEAGRDLLIVGKIPGIIADKTPDLNLVLNESEQSLGFPGTFLEQGETRRRDSGKSGVIDPAVRLSQRGYDGISGIISFESPFKDGRTAVALMADSAAGFQALAEHLIVNKTADDIAGTVAILNSGTVKNAEVGHSYYVGHLAWYQRVWYVMLRNPWLLFLCSLVTAVILCWAAYRLIRRWRSGRMSV